MILPRDVLFHYVYCYLCPCVCVSLHLSKEMHAHKHIPCIYSDGFEWILCPPRVSFVNFSSHSLPNFIHSVKNIASTSALSQVLPSALGIEQRQTDKNLTLQSFLSMAEFLGY